MIETKNAAFDIEAERKKILDGTYPARIIWGRQRKHTEGTREFEQNCEKMQRLYQSNSAILTADAQILVDKYKGTGDIEINNSSIYPREFIKTDRVVGKVWVKSLKKYVDTKHFMIIHSSDGVHVVPISDYEGRK
jgi:hypothetical protein